MAPATKEFIDQANQFLHDGLIDRAIQEYKKALDSDPNLIEVHERLPKTYLSVGKIKEALAEYSWLADYYIKHSSIDLAIINLREILSLDSDQLDAREKLAQAYLKQGNNRSATTERMILANKYIALNQKEQAITLFREILSADENNVDVRKRLIGIGQTIFDQPTFAKEYLSLVESYLKRQAPEKAMTAFQGYKELYKEDAATEEKFAELLENGGFTRESTEIYKQCAEAYSAQKNTDKAKQIFEKLLSLNPADTNILKRIDTLKVSPAQSQEGTPTQPKQETLKFEETPAATQKVTPEKQDASSLQKSIDQSISIGSLDDAKKNLLVLAEEYIKSNRVEDAIASLKKAVEMAPKDTKIHERLVLFLKEKSKISELREENIRFANEILRTSPTEKEKKLAEETILAAIQVDPDHLETYIKLVEFYDRLRNREKSCKASLELAQVALRQKKYDLVEQTCQKILGIDPGFVQAREVLVESFKAKNMVPRAVEELSRLADQFLLKQSFEKAIDAYKEALELDPKNSPMHKNLIVTYLQSGNTAEAVKRCLLLGKLHQSLKAFPEAATVYRRALELDPANYEAHERLAEIAIVTGAKDEAAREYHEMSRLSLSAGNAKQAIEGLSKAISISPQTQEYYEEIAEICLSQNQTSQSNKYLLQLADLKTTDRGAKESIPVLQKILSTEPDNIEALEKLAFAFESTKNINQAVQEYTKAAEIHQKKKNAPQAITVWNKALNLDKDSPTIRENLVNLYIIVRRTSEAAEQLLWLSNYYLNSNAKEKAISCTQRILEINPQNVEARFVLADIHAKQGDVAAAIGSLEQIAELAKKNKQWDTARSAYNKAIELDPENPKLRNARIQIELSSGNTSQTAEQYDSLGQLYVQKGSLSQACSAFEEALKTDPTNLAVRARLTDLYVQQKDTKAFDALLKLAEANWESGQLEKTMETFNRALDLNSQDEKLLRSIANLHLQMDQQKEATDILYQLASLTLKKNPKDAAVLAQEILQVDSGNTEGRQLLAEAYYKSGAKWDAVREYSILAETLTKAGALPKAIETYKTILEIDSQNLDVFSKLATVYETQNQSDDLIQLLTKYARILLEKKIPDQATTALQKIVTLDPSNVDAHKQLVNLFQEARKPDKVIEQKIILSEIYTKNKQYDLAISELESAKSIQPENTDILWNLIILYDQVHRVPDLLKSYLNLAEIHEKKNSLSEAQDMYKKMLEIEPKETQILTKSAELYLRQKENKEAVKQFRILGEVYRETSKNDLAIESLNRAIKINPDETEVYQTLVELYVQQGKKDIAIQTLFTVADIYINEGNSISCAEAYQAVLSIDPDNISGRIKYAELCGKGNQPELAAEQYHLLAQSYIKVNQLNEAIPALKKVIQYKPQDTSVFIQLAELQIKTNATASALSTYIDLAKLYTVQEEFAKAEESYKKAITLDSTFIPAREGLITLYKDQGKRSEEIQQIFQLADIFQQKNQIEKAISYYQKITYLEPNNLAYREKIAEGYLRWNRPKDAVAQLLEVSATYEKENSFDSAIKVYHRILDIDPTQLDVVQNIVRIQLSQQNTPAALDTFMKHAEKLSKAGKYDLAKDLHQKAIDLNPENPIPRQALIETLRKASRVTEAATQYFALIDLFEKARQLDKAMQTCRDAISFDSSNVIIRERLADMALRSGQPKQATEQYLQLMALYQGQNNTNDMIKSYERYLEINPRDTEIRERFMKLLERLNRNDELIKQHVVNARILVEDGYADKAIKYLKKPSRQFPEDTSLQLVLADAYEKTGSRKYALSTYQELSKKLLSLKQYHQAILPLERLAALDPENLEILQSLFKSSLEIKDIPHVISSCERLVKVYTNQGDISSAISCLESVRNLDPNQNALREKLIDLYNRAGNKTAAIKERMDMADLHETSDRIPESIKILISLIQDQPTNPVIHNKLLKLYLKTGQKNEAYKHYLDLSEIYGQKKQFTESADSLKQAVTLEPENPTAHLHLITLYRTTSQHKEALNEYWKLGDLYEKSNQLNEAVRCYQQALELEPFSTDLHIALITIFQQQKKTTEVISQYQLLAETYAQENKFKEATDAYKKALEMDPKDVQVHLKMIESLLAENDTASATQEYKSLAEQYLQSENIDSAIVTYIRLIELNEKDKELRKDLAKLYQRIGKTHEYTAENLNLANLLLDDKQTEEAIPIFKDILEREPNNLHARNGLARAYVEMGDEKSALKEFLFVNQVLSKSGMGSAVHIERVKHAGIQLSPKFTFDNFVVGQHSNFAYATSLAVSKNPGRSYNPLFLYSEPGMGKTHLLNALGNYIRKNYSNLKIMYSTSETFTSELVNAIETNTVPEFRALYRNVDVLLLEDVQFLGGKERAQEEFFHTFNVLIQSNKQVVLTSDRPPKELATLENRITSRFLGGIIIDIQKPDVETRLAILKQKVKQAKIKLDDAILDKIATGVDTNVRELEGALNKLLAYHENAKIEITMDLANNLLRDVLPSK
jgi:chromosomal replication initiator protein DnaA